MRKDRFAEMVLAASFADDWDNARTEWTIMGCTYDDSMSQRCVCGHCRGRLREAYAIRDSFTGEVIAPVSADCVMTLGTWWTRDDVKSRHALFRLIHRIDRWGGWDDVDAIPYGRMLFGESLLRFMYDAGGLSLEGEEGWDDDIVYGQLVELLDTPVADRTEGDEAFIHDVLTYRILPWLKEFAAESGMDAVEMQSGRE